MKNVFFAIVVILLLGVGGVLLQIFLSKKDSKWLGLILPIITFSISVIAVANVAMFSIDVKQTLLTIVSVLAIYNIPTVILLCVYKACRSKIKERKDIEKMNIQDLQ